LLCKVPIFFIHRLGSTDVYQEEKKKVGIIIKKKILMTSLLGDGKVSTYNADTLSWQKQMLCTGSVVREGESLSVASFENISVSGGCKFIE
jgi:hypothetical protein